MLNAVLETCPWVRQAMLLGERGAVRVATDDDAVSPAFAVEQRRSFEALGARFALGALTSAICADNQVALSFHRAGSSPSTLVIVSPPRGDRLGQYLDDLDARTASLR